MVQDDLQSQPSEGRETPFSVTQITRRIKGVLGATFPSVWVVGEISDLARPRSGHVYLTLKDDQSQIRAVLWRGMAQRLKFDLADGQQVLCRGEVDVYVPRGSYQLVIRRIEPRGLGSLEQRLRELQRKLAAEGLFAPQWKKPLPTFPRRVAVVTSPTGAAVRDFLEVVRKRWQGVDILIVPTRVQGDGAAAEIARAVRQVNRLQPSPDVLVVTRGGGSMEDLWCFNEENVVRAIFASRIPVVSAVGHEIDVTLSDLVADVRALTPTDAAQRVIPSSDELAASLGHFHSRLAASLNAVAHAARTRLEAIAARRALRRPLDRVRDLERRLDELHLRATRAANATLRAAQRHVQAAAGRLESLSPLNVLARGYTVTQAGRDGPVVRDASQLNVGDELMTRYARGRTLSRVESIETDDDEERKS
ncbi:MAG: exodeoxyribonuclease VII large subunit [Planctomycetota bacterium]